MGKGTTPDDPVTEEHVPDLELARHETNEYLQEKGVYSIFDFLMKELMTKRPEKPLEHLKACLQTQYPAGPLKIIVSSPPGLERNGPAKRLAETFGLRYIGVGELLDKAGVAIDKIGYADEEQVIKLVMPKLREATKQMEGWVLDGFPRTRLQTTYLKEAAIVPVHVLVLKASEAHIRDRNHSIELGHFEGNWINPDVLEEKLRLHICHDATALEIYKDRVSCIDVEAVGGDPDTLYRELVAKARRLPRSRGPQPPPRVVLLGPRGVGIQEHALRLAARMDAVFVDAKDLQDKQQAQEALKKNAQKTPTSMGMPNQDSLIAEDPLGVVGVRLRQPDCIKQGWILCGFPRNAAAAKALQEDDLLRPTRAVALSPSEETCVQRLRHILFDPVTGKVWRSLPKNDHIRKRLQRNPEDLPAAVIEGHMLFCKSLPGIFQGFGADARCVELPANDPPLEVFKELAEFVERPLPLPLPNLN